MESQTDVNGKTMLPETLVRASVHRCFLSPGQTEGADREIKDNIESGFPWLKDLVDLLGRDETDRQTHPDLDAFMPVMVEFFAGYQATMAKRGAERPQGTGMTPAIAIRLSWACCRRRGWRVDSPTVVARFLERGISLPWRTRNSTVLGGSLQPLTPDSSWRMTWKVSNQGRGRSLV